MQQIRDLLRYAPSFAGRRPCHDSPGDRERGTVKLHVGNLPYNISDDQLEALFSKVGKPDSARVIMDRDTGQSKGFGFVEFNNPDQAKQALALDGIVFSSRVLRISEARPKNDDRAGFRRSR